MSDLATTLAMTRPHVEGLLSRLNRASLIDRISADRYQLSAMSHRYARNCLLLRAQEAGPISGRLGRSEHGRLNLSLARRFQPQMPSKPKKREEKGTPCA